MAVATPSRPEVAGRVRTAAFSLVAVALFLLMFAASAPSPLYVVYQRMWGFTPATLTAVFAVYVLGLLVMLVSAGALSDYVGRKPVLVSAIVAEAGSMLLFVLAEDVGWLYAARILQGLATGAATGAISAALIDLERRPGTGALVNSATPTAGLAVGALGVGLLVQFAPAPTKLVYILLLVAFLGTAIALLFTPEPVTRRPGALRSLRPQLGVPPGKLRAFLTVLPSLVVPWTLGGLYLSLGRSLVVDILGIDNPVAGGLVVFLLTGTGAAASVLVRNWQPQAAMTVGASALAVGVAAVLVALAVAFAPLFFAATVLGGFGFGATFLGAFRTATALAPPGGRAALVATIYTACYLSFSLPSLAAGLAATHVGLPVTATWYGLMVITLAILAIVARRLRPKVR
ncbi:arabinose efflux permease family protein [Saccharomonospora marina XMU15]|uniref:Arabinose efflux permease family protein n=1 Tax=Saccharomonospora marina XMU15 TaxID=882083 RepID=H5X7X5_9PSEU|nr:MFS transporter [Saccharomonospora marina]EHR52475.1 arabinose efflux permease family protein [Saccharomonospora marina XMU15]